MFDNDLLNFKTKYPDLYNDYIDLIVLINSINGNSINLLINLISTLTYQNYNDLSQNQKIYMKQFLELHLLIILTEII